MARGTRRKSLQIGRIASIDEQTIEDLQTLRDLYFRPNKNSQISVEIKPNTASSQKQGLDGEESGEPPSQKKVNGDGTRGNELPEERYQETGQQHFHGPWIIGPN
ncbi:hypothetical protein N7532_003942 [Penicillium argentinense]|uniref:Uncharacterized protein n=1 Tax=Penicillium argentinense TaxID=1131581 RepID=A0A9W9FNJ6_9EURO|nr:uncharacterized protein N7532_003942 [Penicillium argentinense]KAJ5103413.1 hypothetical protein N7532_003942 [Penicillium argentinense]